MTNNAKRVAKSRKKSGSKRVTFDLKPDENEVLERLAKKHGGKKAAFIAGMRALGAVNETDWPAELRRLASELEA